MAYLRDLAPTGCQSSGCQSRAVATLYNNRNAPLFNLCRRHAAIELKFQDAREKKATS